jgi:hypothetical protein
LGLRDQGWGGGRNEKTNRSQSEKSLQEGDYVLALATGYHKKEVVYRQTMPCKFQCFWILRSGCWKPAVVGTEDAKAVVKMADTPNPKKTWPLENRGFSFTSNTVKLRTENCGHCATAVAAVCNRRSKTQFYHRQTLKSSRQNL